MRKVIPENAVLIPDNAVCVFEGRIFKVYQWPQEMYDGSTETFEMIKRPDTVSALCVLGDKIIIQNEEQPNGIKRTNIPGGRVGEDDPNILRAMQREVLEEAGYTFDNWRLLKVVQPQKKIEWFVNIFLAWGVSKRSPATYDSGEKISLQEVTFDEFKQRVVSRDGSLGSYIDIFEGVSTIDELCMLPEFEGKTVDR